MIKYFYCFFALFLAFNFGCSENNNSNKVADESKQGDEKTGDKNDDSKKEPTERRFTYRGVAGASMGGGAASKLGIQYHEKWDFIGALSTPLADLNELFSRQFKRFWMGGYCSLEELEEFMAKGVDLNSEEAFCGIFSENKKAGMVGERMMVPASWIEDGKEPLYEFVSDNNHFWRGYPAGRGGSWSRKGLFQVIEDVIKGHGNPFYELNKEFPWAAPGITKEWLEMSSKEKCKNPIIQKNVYNKEYNPEGKYPVITFCEGDVKEKDSDPLSVYARIAPDTERKFPVHTLLAVDLNGNGVKDYAEPVFFNDSERFIDSGIDGKLSKDEKDYDPLSNPDPEGDDYDPLSNPDGTEGDARFQIGEAYEDFGLDGVADTKDFGEGNGRYDISEIQQSMRVYDPGQKIETLTSKELSRINFYFDAGIRDWLNSAPNTNNLFAKLKKKIDPKLVREPKDFNGLSEEAGKTLSVFHVPKDKFSQYCYVRYGELHPDEKTLKAGNGDHVGSFIDLINRVRFLMTAAQYTWPDLDDEIVPYDSDDDRYQGSEYFDSKTLGKKRIYSYLLPPGYHDEKNKDKRYPVLYFLHGSGMSHDFLVGFSSAIQKPMVTDKGDGKAIWGKFIMIMPDGKCPKDVCNEGTFYMDFSDGKRENQFTFYRDFVDGNKDARFEADLLELMDHVDTKYRTRKEEIVKLPAAE